MRNPWARPWPGHDHIYIYRYHNQFADIFRNRAGLIYYGLQYIIPDYFLPIGLLLCSLTSISIGTSWGTVGTMGLAMMGIGAGMGIPAPLTAGMVSIRGHFSEIRCHPYQTSTNLAPAAAGTTLYAHIGAMWKTTFPSYIITLAVFTVLGLSYHGKGISAWIL